MADYNITAVTRRKVFSGSAGVGPYAFTFPILTQTDIVVYKNSTQLVLTTDYTVTINGTNGTGSVTLVSAATASDTITIIGARAIQRTTDFVTAGDLAASSLNEQLDGLTIMVQQLAEENKRTVKAPPYDPEAVEDGGILNMQLPAKADRAGKVMAFDTNGNPSAGAVSLPSSLTATYYPRVNTGGTAYELRAPASVRADIGADNASNLTSGTISNSLLPGTIDGKTITNVSITSGSITGITDLAVADGGTGASTAANARTNLGAAASGTNADITSMTGITGGIATADFIQFDTAATVTDATGKLYYNKEDQFQTLAFQMNGSAVQKIGEELYYRVKLTANAAKGDVMMFTGTIGASGGLTAAPATGLTADQANYILGIATEAGSTNDWIFVTNFGEVKGIDTTGGGESWVQGQILYYNPSVTGGLTKTKPTTPNAIAVMAAVVHVHASNGILFVRPSFGSVLGGTDGNVQFGTLNNGDVIVYDSGDARWENKAQSTLTAGSVNGSATITSGTISGITALSVAGTSSTTGEIKLYEDTDNGTNYVGIKAPASISADISWTLPAADGASGQLLSTNGSGTLSWTTPAGGGDVSGPASSTDNAIVRFDLTSGKAIQNSVATLSDTGVLTTAEVSTDTISEKTAAAGVTIDGVLLKDSAVTTDTINEKTAAAGVTIDGTLLKDKAVYPDGADTNTFIAVPVADTVAITTNGSERLRVNSTGDVGIGTNSPGSALDVKGTVRLSGATSGYVGLAPAAAAGSTTYTLPSADGTSGQMLSTNGSGVLSWATAAVGANGNVSIGFVGSAVNSTGSSLVWNSTGSLTWTVPTGVTKCKVTVLGGGGGGGGTSNATPIGAGGGAGGCAIKWVTGLTPGGTVAVTVGAAGTTGSNAAGGAGGTSSFGSHASATGGSGGGRNNASTIQTSGTNGAGSSGDINISGDVKISSVYGVELAGGSADRFNSVAGADAPLGLGFGGRERIQTGANQAGAAATGYGAGGGGAIYVSGNQAGGAATPGIVIIEW